MPYAIITTDKPDHAHLRDAHQAAHKKYLDANKHRLLAAGAMLDDEGSAAHGGVLIVDTESRKEAEEFVKGDPFSEAGLFEKVMITRWRKAFFNRERLVDL
ncbi:MAG: YciI family protein [Akkermansiaceae bacterium]|nr:YciI family protein [Akkermansiaceae bacterium]